MMQYKRYKPLSELWLSSVPEHWEIKKIKYLFSERSEKGYPDEPLLVASQNMGVVPKGVYGNRTVEAMKDLQLLKLVRVGDFVISLRSFQGGIEYAYYQGIISPAYTIMIPKVEMTAGYFRYLAKSRLFIELLQLCVTGIREGQNVDYSKLKNHRIPVPPRDEQDQIVRYLDWQVSKINRLIAAKKKQIALLTEQEQSVIDHVVIHGLDSLVKTKVSSVDWIGHIPIDWKSIKIRRFCTLQNGISESGEFFLTGSPFVSYGDVYKHLTLPETVNGVANSSYEQQQTFSVCKGDIFFTRTSETIDEVGMPTVCLHTIEKAVFSGFLIRVRPIEDMVSSDYLKYYLRYSGIQRYFARTMNIVIRASLGQNLLKELTILIPPQTEQAEIATYLDKKHEQFETIRVGIEKEIAALHDLRTRLISDAVTGQIDVRGIEIPDFEYAEEATEANDTEEAENETTDEQEE